LDQVDPLRTSSPPRSPRPARAQTVAGRHARSAAPIVADAQGLDVDRPRPSPTGSIAADRLDAAGRAGLGPRRGAACRHRVDRRRRPGQPRRSSPTRRASILTAAAVANGKHRRRPIRRRRSRGSRASTWSSLPPPCRSPPPSRSATWTIVAGRHATTIAARSSAATQGLDVGGCCGAVAVRPRPARAQTDAGEARDVDQADQFAATIAASEARGVGPGGSAADQLAAHYTFSLHLFRATHTITRKSFAPVCKYQKSVYRHKLVDILTFRSGSGSASGRW